MMVLGVETSTAVCSVGLVNESGLSAEQSLVESHIHSEKLLMLIRALCESQNKTLAQLDGIAISIGPGSFTGLRIGLSTAKGLCYSLEKPLVAVSTFEALAMGVFKSHPEYTRTAICIDAKQGEYYFGMYERADGKVFEALPVQILNLTTAFENISDKTLLVTDRVDEVEKCSGDSVAVKDVLSYCRGDAVAGIAVEKLKIGIKSSLENLEPLYLKDFIVKKIVKSEKMIQGS